MTDSVSSKNATASDIVSTLGVGKSETPWWRRVWFLVLVAVAVLSIGYTVFKPKKATEYITSKISIETLRSVVTATGTLQPVDKVTVGAEVSGRMDEILVDFNSVVKKGQVIARINTDELKARALQARANVAQFSATLAKAEGDLKRASSLRTRGFVSQSAYDSILATRNSAAASLNSAKAQAEQAEANLEKAVIRSPIDGIILDRKIERGQTVTAGFQTPELFVIASDLKRLELTVDIDEADIGQVSVGQEATFTVDAFPAQEFKARVEELRNAARTIQNVVTYQGVLAVENKAGLLKPGMTATADITVKVVQSVPTIANGALRFSPEPQAVQGMVPTATVAPVDPIASGKGKLWVAGKDGQLTSRDVTLGITDGQRTHVTSGNVKVDEAFVVDVAQPGRTGQQ